jgi:hypothetical protein
LPFAVVLWIVDEKLATGQEVLGLKPPFESKELCRGWAILLRGDLDDSCHELEG